MTKWGGSRHWQFSLEPLGTDRFGRWLAGSEGLQAQRGDEPPVVLAHRFVMLVPADGCWIASFDAGGQFEVYVDVTTRPEVSQDVVTAVDLDLDVVRRWDGRVEVLDEDEFALHQVNLGYPAAVIGQARATAEWLVRAISTRMEPFDQVGAGWLAKAAP